MALGGADVVVFSGWSSTGGPSEAEQMRDAWRGPDVELVVEPTARTRPRTRRGRCRCCASARIERAVVVCAPTHLARTRLLFGRLYRGAGVEVRVSRRRRRAEPPLRAVGARGVPAPAGAAPRCPGRARAEAASERHRRLHPGLERGGEPARRARRAARASCRDADVLVVDDGSTDRTADVAREHGAEVLSFGENQRPAGRDRGRLPLGARARLRVLRARRRGRPASGRRSSRGCSTRVRADECDVAVGSRFVSGDGYAPYRYRPSPRAAPRDGAAAPLDGARAAAGRSATRRAASTP